MAIFRPLGIAGSWGNRGTNMDNQKFAERLKALRLEAKLTQVRLGAMVGLTFAAIGGYESGRRLPGIEIVVGLAEALDVNVGYLLGTEDDTERAGRRLHLKDYLPHLSDDMRRFLVEEHRVEYIVVAKEAADAGLGADLLHRLVQALKEAGPPPTPGQDRDPETHGQTMQATGDTAIEDARTGNPPGQDSAADPGPGKGERQ